MQKEICYEIYAWSSLPRREHIAPLKLNTFLSHLVAMCSKDPDITIRVLKDDQSICGGVPIYSFSTSNADSMIFMSDLHNLAFYAVNAAFGDLKPQFRIRQIRDHIALKTALKSKLTGEISESCDTENRSEEFEDVFETLAF